MDRVMLVCLVVLQIVQMVYLFTLYMKTDNIEYRMQLFTNRHFRPKRVDTSPIEREPNA